MCCLTLLPWTTAPLGKKKNKGQKHYRDILISRLFICYYVQMQWNAFTCYLQFFHALHLRDLKHVLNKGFGFKCHIFHSSFQTLSKAEQFKSSRWHNYQRCCITKPRTPALQMKVYCYRWRSLSWRHWEQNVIVQHEAAWPTGVCLRDPWWKETGRITVLNLCLSPASIVLRCPKDWNVMYQAMRVVHVCLF